MVAGLQIRVHTGKLFFLFLHQNICCGYSKELSQWDSSFEHPKHMFKLMGKEIYTILGAQTIFIWTYVVVLKRQQNNIPHPMVEGTFPWCSWSSHSRMVSSVYPQKHNGILLHKYTVKE